MSTTIPFEQIEKFANDTATIAKINERLRIVDYLRDRIENHEACIGRHICSTCISFSQVINFALSIEEEGK
jgi:ferredoxin